MRWFSLVVLATITIAFLFGHLPANDDVPFQNVQTEFNHERIIFQSINEVFDAGEIVRKAANLTLSNKTFYTFELLHTATHEYGFLWLELEPHEELEDYRSFSLDSRGNYMMFTLVPRSHNYTLRMSLLPPTTETIRVNLTIWREFPPHFINHTEYITVWQNVTITQQMSIFGDPNLWIPILGGEVLVAVILILWTKDIQRRETGQSAIRNDDSLINGGKWSES